jgi:hypothetical protein
LFVRVGDWVSGAPLDGRIVASDEATALLVAALAKCCGSADFDLLCINFCQWTSPPMRGEAMHASLIDPTSDWRGSDDLWSGLFARHAATQLSRSAPR